MSYEACTWARAQATGSCARKAVLMALANWADADGSVKRIRVAYLVESTDLSRSVVFQRLRELERGGAIERERAKDKTGQVVVSGQLRLWAAFDLAALEGAPAPETAGPGEAPAGAESGGPDWGESGPPDSGSPAGRTGGVRRAGLASIYEEKDLEKNTHAHDRADAGARPAAGTIVEGGEKASEGSATDRSAHDFDAFLRAYPFDAAMDVGEARAEFAKLSQKDRARAVRRAGLYAVALRRGGREARDAAGWLAARAFAEAEAAAKAQGPELVFVARGTRAWAAWASVRRSIPVTQGPAGKTGWWFPSLWPPGVTPTGPPDDAG